VIADFSGKKDEHVCTPALYRSTPDEALSLRQRLAPFAAIASWDTAGNNRRTFGV